MTSRKALAFLLIVVVALLLLTGCSGPITTDNAIGTLPVPNGATDCQIRISNAHIEGGGIAVQGSGSARVVSVIGAANCSQEMLDEALGIRRIPTPMPDLERRVRALEEMNP